MKKILFALLLFAGITVRVNAQTAPVSSDSTENKSINVNNPYAVSEQSIKIADSTSSSSSAASGASLVQTYSSGRETETIHIYSGSHQGNNVVRTMEVPRPQK